MKKIEIKKEIVNYNYEAMDGTLFDSPEECAKYEKSAKGILMGRLKKFTIREGSEYDLFGRGMDDSRVHVVSPKTADDIDTIKQVLAIFDNPGAHEELDDKIGKVIFITWGYDEDYACTDTLDAMTARIMGE